MKSIAVSSRLIASASCAAAFLFIIAFSPASASAQTVPGSVQTGELLPPGQNTCQVVSITSIQPHIYGGVLESFDVTISDTSNSYVGIFAQVGNTPISLAFITRWAGLPSGLMIHVDTPDTAVNGVLPITLTLLSSPPNAPTCVTTVSFAVSSSDTTLTSSSTSQPVSGGYPATGSNTYPSTSVTGNTAPTSSGLSNTAKPSTSTSTKEGTDLGTSTAAAIASVSNSSFFSSVCSGSNAFRLWFVLLIIYVIIVAIVVFSEPWFLESSVIASTAVILVPLILLLAFWYLSPSCRAASWIPVVACIIAIIGLFLAFREYELPPLLPAASEQ